MNLTCTSYVFQCQYGQQPWCNQLQSLVKIVLNTLDTQHHQCKRIPATVVMDAPPSRSRGTVIESSNNLTREIFTSDLNSKSVFLVLQTCRNLRSGWNTTGWRRTRENWRRRPRRCARRCTNAAAPGEYTDRWRRTGRRTTVPRVVTSTSTSPGQIVSCDTFFLIALILINSLTNPIFLRKTHTIHRISYVRQARMAQEFTIVTRIQIT